MAVSRSSASGTCRAVLFGLLTPSVGLQLRHSHSFGGSRGDALGSFNAPRHVAALPNGGTCVVDGLNQRVQIFDANSRPLRTIDGLEEPTGVAVAPDDDVQARCRRQACCRRRNQSELDGRTPSFRRQLLQSFWIGVAIPSGPPLRVEYCLG